MPHTFSSQTKFACAQKTTLQGCAGNLNKTNILFTFVKKQTCVICNSERQIEENTCGYNERYGQEQAHC